MAATACLSGMAGGAAEVPLVGPSAGKSTVKAVYDSADRTLLYVEASDVNGRIEIDRPLWMLTLDELGVVSSTDFEPTADGAARCFLHNKSGLICTWKSVAQGNFIRHFYTLEATKPVLVKKFVALAVPGQGFQPGGNVLGSPLVSGNWFAGMEYPTAHTTGDQAEVGTWDLLTQYADCNRKLEPGQSVTYSSVIGHKVSGSLRRGVLEYIEAPRARPYKPFLHYNSWYDIADQGKDGLHVMDSDQCLRVMQAWNRDFMAPYGIRVDTFVFDDGWDDYDNLWCFHPKRFPQGFAPQAKLAKEIGTHIGTWFSPFGGYGGTKNARLKTAGKAGYEINGRGLSLAGEKYYALFHGKCVEMIEKHEVNYFKFDGVGAGSPEYIPDMDAACRLMARLREVDPDVYINLTTGTWGSPFFLLHGDSIWRGGSDALTWGNKGPMTHRWLNYRDGNTYNNIVKQSPLFPLNSLMLCGMVYSRLGLGRTSVDKTDKSFADQAWSFCSSYRSRRGRWSNEKAPVLQTRRRPQFSDRPYADQPVFDACDFINRTLLVADLVLA